MGNLAGVSLRQPDLGSGDRVRYSGVPYLETVLGAQVLGFLLRMEDLNSPWSETEWVALFSRDFRTHHLAESGDRAGSNLASAIPYLLVG